MTTQDFKYEFESIYNRGELVSYRALLYKKHENSIIGWYRNDDHISSDDLCFCLHLDNQELQINFQNTESGFEDKKLREELAKLRNGFFGLSALEPSPLSLFLWLEYELYLEGTLQSVPYTGTYEYHEEIAELSPVLRKELDKIYVPERYDELYPLFRRYKFQSLMEELATQSVSSTPERKIQHRVVARDSNFLPYVVDWLALSGLWNKNSPYFVHHINPNIYRENWFTGNRELFILGEIYFDNESKSIEFKNGRHRTLVLGQHMRTVPIAIERSALNIEVIQQTLIRPIEFQDRIELPDLIISNLSPTDLRQTP